METLHQIFMTVIAAFLLFILIAKIASSLTNGDQDDRQRRRIRDLKNVSAEELNSKLERSSRKRKSMKKVRFAVDHDESLVNKVVAGPSGTKQLVFENNHVEETVSLYDVASEVKSPEEKYAGVENSASDDDNKSRAESVSPSVVDCSQTQQGKTEFVDQTSSEGTMSDDGIEKNHNEDLISLNDVISVVKSPEEISDSDNNKLMPESVTRDTESVDQQSSQCAMVPDQNAAIDNKHHQMCMKLLFDDGIDESEKEKEGLISSEEDSDDDWEGIEKSDLEKVFAMAADYGKEDNRLQSLGSDIQMQLYGLHKVATEGPCHESQPIALKLSARSKWKSEIEPCCDDNKLAEV